MVTDNGTNLDNLSHSETFTITVNAVNDAPTVAVPGSQSVAAGEDLFIAGVTIADVDAGAADFRVQLDVGFGSLAVRTGVAGGLSAAGVQGNGTDSVVLTGTLAEINATLAASQGLKYVSQTGYAGADSLVITADDQGNTGSGGPKSGSGTVAISVSGGNQAPVVTVPAAQTVAEDTDLVIQGITIVDADAGLANVRVSLAVTLGMVNLNENVSGGLNASQIQGNGTATVTLTGTIAEINTTLADSLGLQYRAQANYSGSDVLTVTANDLGNMGSGGAKTDTKQVVIAVTAVNDAPTVAVPGSQAVAAGQELFITGIAVADVDAGAADIQVQLEVSHGILAVRTDVPGGLSAANVQGNGTGSVVLTGTVAEINATLAASQGLKYVSEAGYAGADDLTVTANDRGNTGAGGAKTDTENLPIAVFREVPSSLTLTGRLEDDVLTIAPGFNPGEWIVTLNGTPYPVAGARVTVSFDGVDGYDTVSFTGGNGVDTAVLRPTSAELAGSGLGFPADSYTMSITNIDAIDYDGGAGDTVTIWGSRDTETYTAEPGRGWMTGENVSIDVTAERIYARGNGGGDTVRFKDGDGDDVLEYFSWWARMRGEGYFHHVRGFKTMEADATVGQNDADRVVVRGSQLNDYLRVNPHNDVRETSVVRFLSGSGSVWHTAYGFETIAGYGLGGALIDELVLNDTPGTDTFDVRRLQADLDSPDYGVTVATHGFGTVEVRRAYANGSADEVSLGDSQYADHDDTVVGDPRQVTMSGPGYVNKVLDFPSVRAYSSGRGRDTAWFSDLADPDDSRTGVDTFTGRPLFSQLEGPGYKLYARLFDEVYAESKYGQDIANLHGNANGAELTGTATEVRLSGTHSSGSYANHAGSFHEVNAFGDGNEDKALLADAAVDTTTFGPPVGVPPENLPQYVWLNSFEKIDLAGSDISGADPVFAYWGAPSVDAVAASPDPVVQGSNVTLTATGVADSDGTVAKVEFYRDTNGNGALEPETDDLLGADTNGGDGWTWTGSTATFPTGTNRYFARAQDDAGLWSSAATTTATVSTPANQAPTIGSLSDSPDPVIQGNNLTLTANGVTDTDGTVVKVEFYRDTNGNGSIEPGIDLLLGSDTNSSGGWTWSGSTSAISVGTNTYLARAQDDDLAWSNTVSTTGTVSTPANQAPAIGSLSDSPDPVIQGNNLTLTANGVTDTDGTVVKVEFYRDANGNGSIEPGTDLLLGSDTSSIGGWVWSGSTSTLPAGSNRYLARAQDDDLAWSNTVSTMGTINAPPNQAPTIGSLSDSPDPVLQGNNLTLTANGVTDTDGTIVLVEFYRDSDGSGTLESDTDELLGADTLSSDGWSWTGSTASFPTGANRYFARAQDDDLLWSGTATTTGMVTLLGAPDQELPRAFSAPEDVFSAGGTRYEFDVLYTDNIAIDVSTFGNSDIRVYCPLNGFTKTATFVSFTPSTGGSSVTATYYITPPGGSWDSIDNAPSYQILVVAGQVSDTNGHDVEAGYLGDFRVSVPASSAQPSASDVDPTADDALADAAWADLAQALWLDRFEGHDAQTRGTAEKANVDAVFVLWG